MPYGADYEKEFSEYANYENDFLPRHSWVLICNMEQTQRDNVGLTFYLEKTQAPFGR